MAGEVGVSAIGTVDSLRWGPSGNMSGGRRHELVCLYPGLIHIVARSRVTFSFSLSISLSLSLSLYLCLSLSHYLSPLSLSLYLFPYLSISWIQKKNGPPVSTPNSRRPGAHQDGQPCGM